MRLATEAVSSHGMASARLTIAVLLISLMIWALLSIFKPWSLAIWAGILARVLHLPGIPLPVIRKLYGDYLLNAQGEDVVAGIRNTEPDCKMAEEMPQKL
jgi:hypothetical protein